MALKLEEQDLIPAENLVRTRKRTESIRRLAKRTLERGRFALAASPVNTADRPRTWGACKEAGLGTPETPCPFVACKHHIALEMNQKNGAIQYVWPGRGDFHTEDEVPDLRLEEYVHTCSLRVAERGGMTLEEVGASLNLTRERVRQIETAVVRKIRRFGGGKLAMLLLEYMED